MLKFVSWMYKLKHVIRFLIKMVEINKIYSLWTTERGYELSPLYICDIKNEWIFFKLIVCSSQINVHWLLASEVCHTLYPT